MLFFFKFRVKIKITIEKCNVQNGENDGFVGRFSDNAIFNGL